MWKVKLRPIISTLLIIVFAIVVVTGIGLYLAPSGRIAREAGWTFLTLDKWKLENLHTYMGFFMAVLVGAHIVINWDMYINEIKMLFRG